jgi:hypothetical protein
MKLDIEDLIYALQSGVDARVLIKQIYSKALNAEQFVDKYWLIDKIEDYFNGDE